MTKNPMETSFDEVVHLIQSARQKTFQMVNTTLIDLYWRVGAYISRKLESAEWGDGVVAQLAAHIIRTQPGLRGFTRPNLFRMRQFYEIYRDDEKVSPLVRQLSWTHNLIIFSQGKHDEEREFYLRQAIQERWSTRELARQFRAALFERTVLHPVKVSPVVRQKYPEALNVFKDSYMVEYLDLPEGHDEKDLHRGLLNRLKAFLCELGRDFCFAGSEFPIQVGNRDFYLEALDRDVKKAHESPAIGVLLCASKDAEVVEYALSRSLSPAMIAKTKPSCRINGSWKPNCMSFTCKIWGMMIEWFRETPDIA